LSGPVNQCYTASHRRCCRSALRCHYFPSMPLTLRITVSEIQRDICEKNRHFIIPLAFDALVRGVPVRISAPLWYGKTTMVSLPEGKKHFEDIFIRFDVIRERNRRTDGH